MKGFNTIITLMQKLDAYNTNCKFCYKFVKLYDKSVTIDNHNMALVSIKKNHKYIEYHMRRFHILTLYLCINLSFISSKNLHKGNFLLLLIKMEFRCVFFYHTIFSALITVFPVEGFLKAEL